MYQITIRPLHKLLQENPKPEITAAEFSQLLNQIARRRPTGKAPANSPARQIRNQQIRCLKQVGELFRSQRRRAKTAIAARVDEVLSAAGFKYEAQQHPPAHNNRLWATAACYDLAFYSPKISARAPINSHHYTRINRRTRPALFYIRCEEQENCLLIGNMQIDAKAREYNCVEHLIMTVPKNIQLALVHHAARHALEKAPQRILFQAGDSACQAQFRKNTYQRVLITAANLDEYQALHARYHEKEFAVQPGDRCGLPIEGEIFNHIVRATTATRIIARREDHSAYNLINVIVQGFMHFPEITSGTIRCKFALESAVEEGAPEKIVKYLEEFIDRLGLPRNNKIASAQKIGWLRKIIPEFANYPGDSAYDRKGVALGNILRKWGYEAKLLKKFTGLIRQKNARTQAYFYVDLNHLFNDVVIPKGQAAPPQVGKYYFMHKEPTAGSLDPRFLRWDKHYQIYNWYEILLPKMLQKLGLEIKKVPVPAGVGGPAPGTTAWEVIGGQQNFRTRPHLCF